MFLPELPYCYLPVNCFPYTQRFAQKSPALDLRLIGADARQGNPKIRFAKEPERRRVCMRLTSEGPDDDGALSHHPIYRGRAHDVPMAVIWRTKPGDVQIDDERSGEGSKPRVLR